MGQHRADKWSPEEQTIAKLRSSRCDDAFDLHLYPVGGPINREATTWRWAFPVACMTPRSRGALRLASANPETAPTIDHRYLTDVDGHDAAVLADGLAMARELARRQPLAALVGDEVPPFGGDGDDLSRISETVEHYYHPVGTCKLGPVSDPEAVVDSTGAIHGLESGFVADCSIMPVVPRANTNIPAVVVGERIASFLLGA
jgi:choline dehydrogenase